MIAVIAMYRDQKDTNAFDCALSDLCWLAARSASESRLQSHTVEHPVGVGATEAVSPMLLESTTGDIVLLSQPLELLEIFICSYPTSLILIVSLPRTRSRFKL